MRKVAIVGVEGSGKTVLLAGLGALYYRPDSNGYFLSPKNFQTSSYVNDLMDKLRSGKWPAATAEDVFQRLEWTLKRSRGEVTRPDEICEISCLDFAGEVYRRAFVETDGRISEEMNHKVEALWDYIKQANDLIVLVNLSDVIAQKSNDHRVQEALWITNGLLDKALKELPGRKPPRAAIVLSQADNYADTIKSCGGAGKTLEKFLPNLYFSYSWLDIFEVATIDKTVLDDDGQVVPARDFSLNGLLPIMAWILGKGTNRRKPLPFKGGTRSADGGAVENADKSPYKRWVFVLLGLTLGFYGAHLAYTRRWVRFFVVIALMVLTLSVNEVDGNEMSFVRALLGLAWAILGPGSVFYIKTDRAGRKLS